MPEEVIVTAQEKIRDYILAHYPIIRNRDIAYDDPLTGLVDSLGVLALIGYIEPEFNIELSPSDVSEENFASIDSISKLIARLAVTVT